MKKRFSFLSFLVLVLFQIAQTNAQSSNYGVSAGFHDMTLKASVSGFGTGSSGASGYYVGFYGEFGLSEKFYVQPELQFSQVFSGDSDNTQTLETLTLPMLFKYYVAEKFNLQAGPMFDLFLGNESEVSDFGIGLAFGGAYVINDKISLTTKYSLGLNNRTSGVNVGDPLLGNLEVSTKIDYFQFGLTYNF